MNKLIGWFITFVLASGNLFAASGWWVLCDLCTTDSDFQMLALQAPGEYPQVYVSNFQTLETRKYVRRKAVRELGNKSEWTATVFRIDLPEPEDSVFSTAMANGKKFYIDADRNDLVNLVTGVSEQLSVVTDISRGVIDQGVIEAIKKFVLQQDLVPGPSSVNSDPAVDIAGISAGGHVLDNIRAKNLHLTFRYEDGSTLSVTRRALDESFVAWLVTDAEEKLIWMEEDEEAGGASVDRSIIGLRDSSFVFGYGAEAEANQLIDYIQEGSETECELSPRFERDSNSYVEINCSI